jgi:hypothetical protein
MDAEFEVGDGVIGRTVPGSLMRLDIAEADAWAAPADRIRRAIARQIGVRYVYVLHVTERTVMEFVGLAGTQSLKTADALPMLLQFAVDIVDSSSPIREADVAGGPSVRELRSRSPSLSTGQTLQNSARSNGEAHRHSWNQETHRRSGSGKARRRSGATRHYGRRPHRRCSE